MCETLNIVQAPCDRRWFKCNARPPIRRYSNLYTSFAFSTIIILRSHTSNYRAVKVKPLDDFVYSFARHLVENKYEYDAVSNFHLAVLEVKRSDERACWIEGIAKALQSAVRSDLFG